MSKKRVYTKEQLARIAERTRERRALDPERTRQYNNKSNRNRLLKQYSMSEEDYQALWSKQKERCAICLTTEKPHRKNWHLDHDHTTNRVRGILCARCNMLLGHAKDNPKILERAIWYLNV